MTGAGIVRRFARGRRFAAACGLAAMLASRAPAAELSSAGILQELRALQQTARVLYVAAHPDDENTHLITYFARGRGYATGYLSLTRGDGGQNLVGPELREGLGVIRTQELLAARRLDGGYQLFTRAVDFGFSKDHKETMRIWNRREVLGDVVRAIRAFRPDVIVTRFNPEPGETHGHHTASAILAVEAFGLAASDKEFPEQGLQPWQAKRIFWNIFSWTPPGGKKIPVPADALKLDVGGYLPLLGMSSGEMAAASRSMHKSQGMGRVATRGVNVENFKLLAGDPAKTDLLEGVDSTWARFPGGAPIGAAIEKIVAAFDVLAPEKSVPALLAVRKDLRALAPAPGLDEKGAHLDRILAACLGIYVESVVPAADVVAGEKLRLKHTALARGGIPVKWLSVKHVDANLSEPIALQPNVPASRETTSTLPADLPVTQPYWLETPGTVGSYTVANAALIGAPENAPAVPVVHAFEVDGQTLEVEDEPVQVIGDPVKGELRHRLRVIPPVSLEFARPLEIVKPGDSVAIDVELTAARATLEGQVRLNLATGWTAAPATQPFTIGAAGDTARVTFTLTAPAAPTTAHVTATATVGGKEYAQRRIDIRYDHIPPQILQPPCSLTAVCLDLKIHGRRVGYLPGAGDGVDASLERMGYQVKHLNDADLSPAGLVGLDAVVIGIRAFNTRAGLAARLTGLFDWVAQGGTVVAQYNTSNGLITPRLAPFPLTLSRDRVTDENAAVKLLDPQHPALTGPNAIGPADFEGWVQERGLYFPDKWDDAFKPLLGMSDPGEPERKGALLVARHGKGWFVYTGISWFRQLPEGVPGAYRLFANLVSLHP